MSSPKAKKILIAPLDWGLGHATRCIPIIKELINRGCEVQIASSGDALTLLNDEFPELKTHSLPAYDPEYSKSVPFVFKIILQLPKFLKTVSEEHHELEEIVAREKIEIVISDNRYGCWSTKAKSIFISHQLNILLNFPWKIFSPLVTLFNQRQIQKFGECWIPDFPDGLTDRLSHSKNIRSKFIGMLSRFERMELLIRFDVLAIISGPEPQRSLFEINLVSQLGESGLKYFIVKGNLKERLKKANEASYLNSKEINELICSSDFVICRSGYSSIMDLSKLCKKVIFIPTPGQTEQEYLAKELERRGVAYYQTQNEFDLKVALEKSRNYSGFVDTQTTPNLLAQAIDNLITES